MSSSKLLTHRKLVRAGGLQVSIWLDLLPETAWLWHILYSSKDAENLSAQHRTEDKAFAQLQWANHDEENLATSGGKRTEMFWNLWKSSEICFRTLGHIWVPIFMKYNYGGRLGLWEARSGAFRVHYTLKV